MKVVKLFAVVFIVFILLLGGGIYFFLHKQKPHYKGAVYIKGFENPCEILYDSYGIPHIIAQSEPDAYRALGFAVAQERLFQMEMMRRVSSGRLSEVFGVNTLEIDRFFRMVGFNHLASREVERNFNNPHAPWTKACLAYIEGLNHFIENENLPVEFTLLGFTPKPYTPEDMYLIASYMSFSFAMGIKTDPLLQRILQNHGPTYLSDFSLGFDSTKICLPNDCQNSIRQFPSVHDRLSALRMPQITGSNAWIVSPQKSKSNSVLFANDPHIEFSQPAVWYEAHLSYPGVEFTGHFLAGLCFAPLGHSLHHVWGITMLLNDDVDFLFEKYADNDSTKVKGIIKDYPIDVQEEIILVKDSAAEKLIVRRTKNGPICSDVMKDIKSMSDQPVSLSWTYLKTENDLLQVMYGMMHAKNMKVFRRELEKIASPGLNIMYADKENIAWFAAAHFVKRNDSIFPSLFRSAYSNNFNDSYFDPKNNPCSVNPERGYVYSANNQPEPKNGMFHPGYYVNDDRALRITQVLSSKDKLSVEDFKNLQLDDTSQVMNAVKNILIAEIKNVDHSEINAAELFQQLKKWNGSFNKEESTPVFFNQFLFEVLELLLLDELGTEDFKAMLKTHVLKTGMERILKNDSSVWWDNVLTKNHRETKIEIINQAFYNAVRKLNTVYGKKYEKWKWGNAHQLEHPHLIGKQEPLNKILNVGPFATSGGNETVNNMGYEMNEKGKMLVRFGPSMRKILDLAHPEEGWNISPTGQSGNFMSKHYRDQAEMFVNGSYRSMTMNHERIKTEYKSKMMLKPKR
ncbi:MAG TPA: penicillin acylase family protein [Bacteroidia bacterium]|nr:penicillin acylase family protein [Bacteroidia bacterium]HNT79346.1 penicillin acylase family protein [Bacteroidia bacterium]